MTRSPLPLLLALAAAFAHRPACAQPAPAAGPVETAFPVERVFDTSDPGGPYKHPASIAELPNGDLYIAFYGGEGEYKGDTAVWGSRRAKGAPDWTPPAPIADTPGISEGNGVVCVHPDGRTWLFYVVRYGETWSSSIIQAKISKDNAATWSDPVVLSFEPGAMVRGKAIVLESGGWLLPIYHERGNDPESVGPDSVSSFLLRRPGADRWVETGRVKSAKGNIQPSPGDLGGGKVVAYCRRGGDYDPATIGYIVRAESADGGLTWSEGRDTDFPNPNAAVELTKLASGALLLIYNDSMNERNPLTAVLSADGGKTWPVKRDLVKAKGGDYGYPYAIQGADGRIHLVYTSEERSVVNHMVIEEKALAEGQ